MVVCVIVKLLICDQIDSFIVSISSHFHMFLWKYCLIWINPSLWSTMICATAKIRKQLTMMSHKKRPICAWNAIRQRHSETRERNPRSGHLHSGLQSLDWCSVRPGAKVRGQSSAIWLTGCHNQEIEQQNPYNEKRRFHMNNNHQAYSQAVAHTHACTHTPRYTAVELIWVP